LTTHCSVAEAEVQATTPWRLLVRDTIRSVPEVRRGTTALALGSLVVEALAVPEAVHRIRLEGLEAATSFE
jgi:hypothetical protein